MQKKGTEIIGHWTCPVCGKCAPVKKSLRGRLSMVCKWQDDGCGSQLQTLTADASLMMLKQIKLKALDKPKDEPAEKEPEKRAKELPEMKEPKPNKAPSVSESAWGLL
ncbi:MAG: hypothetical protein R8K20_01360 [Gallionellaceae bacterium]